jgi:hypothetical protein
MSSHSSFEASWAKIDKESIAKKVKNIDMSDNITTYTALLQKL